MSARNGDKSRFQINRKRAVVRRAKVRAMVAAGTVGEKRPAHAKPQAAPPGGVITRGQEFRRKPTRDQEFKRNPTRD